MEQAHALRERLTGAASGGATDELTSERVKPGEMWEITTISLKNEDTTVTSVLVYIKGHGYNHEYREHLAPTANLLYWSDKPLYIFEGEQVAIRWTGCTAADKLHGFITGRKHILDDGKPLLVCVVPARGENPAPEVSRKE